MIKELLELAYFIWTPKNVIKSTACYTILSGFSKLNISYAFFLLFKNIFFLSKNSGMSLK